MADWSPLRNALASLDDRVTIAWDELDALVGGLPRSAYQHSAFWSGTRSGWPGFSTVNVRVGEAVTFVRRQPGPGAPTKAPAMASTRQESTVTAADLLLVGCVKRKLDRPAPARDLYTSALFRKGRDYAERSGLRWYILSAEHGLVAPESVLAPYDLRLSRTPRAYRREWGERVLKQLNEVASPLAGKVIEIHAGAPYSEAIRDLLKADGSTVLEPLQGLTIGRRLAWYAGGVAPPAGPASARSLEVTDVVAALREVASAKTPANFLASGSSGLQSPGLYSWWIDQEGAADLQAGLDQPVAQGLIYAGLAGATRSRSGRKSTNTLWSRIRGMHLAGRHNFSTFRLSLGAILASARHEAEIDEDRLTTWMHHHLRVVTIPVQDADALNELETEVLQRLNPPLNLDKVEKNALRRRLSQLRRQHRHKTSPPAAERGQLP